jgi:hypothetical protein
LIGGKFEDEELEEVEEFEALPVLAPPLEEFPPELVPVEEAPVDEEPPALEEADWVVSEDPAAELVGLLGVPPTQLAKRMRDKKAPKKKCSLAIKASFDGNLVSL